MVPTQLFTTTSEDPLVKQRQASVSINPSRLVGGSQVKSGNREGGAGNSAVWLGGAGAHLLLARLLRLTALVCRDLTAVKRAMLYAAPCTPLRGRMRRWVRGRNKHLALAFVIASFTRKPGVAPPA